MNYSYEIKSEQVRNTFGITQDYTAKLKRKLFIRQLTYSIYGKGLIPPILQAFASFLLLSQIGMLLLIFAFDPYAVGLVFFAPFPASCCDGLNSLHRAAFRMQKLPLNAFGQAELPRALFQRLLALHD